MPNRSLLSYAIKPDAADKFVDLVAEAREAIRLHRQLQTGKTTYEEIMTYLSCRLGLHEEARAFKRWFSRGKNRITRVRQTQLWTFVYLAIGEGYLNLEWLNKLLDTLDIYIPVSRRDYLTKTLSECVHIYPIDCKTHVYQAVDPDKVGEMLNALMWQTTYIRAFDPVYERLIGRDSEVETILASLRDPQGMPFILVEANGGWGKTAIAYEVMKRYLNGKISDSPYKDQIWVSAKYQAFEDSGSVRSLSGAARTLDDVVNQILERLGLRVKQTLSLKARWGSVGEYVKASPTLICIDNLETLGDDLSQLLVYLHEYCDDEERRSRFLLTARPVAFTPISHLSRMAIEPLSEVDAGTLIHDYLKLHQKLSRYPSSPELSAIYALVGGVPLVLRQIAFQLEQYSVATILKRIGRAKDANDVRSLYDYIFLPTYQRLDESGHELLLFAATSVGAEGATYEYLRDRCGLNFADFEMALQQLRYHYLLEVRNLNNEDRFSLHSLTREWVRRVLLDLSD